MNDERPDELSDRNIEALTAILADANELIERYGLMANPPATWRHHIEALTTFAVTLLMVLDEEEVTSRRLVETVMPAVWTAFGMGVQAEREGTA